MSIRNQKTRVMFTFEHATFRYQPYPIGLVKPILAPDLYQDFLDAFPPREMFEHIPRFGSKYSLSEKFNRRLYHDYVAKTPLWRDFKRWIKSRSFIDSVDEMLKRHDIDVGMQKRWPTGMRRVRQVVRDMAHARAPRLGKQLGARFEFSMLPADGGWVLPHTDNPTKIITLIVSMAREGEWDPSYGGGTDVNRTSNPRFMFNRQNCEVPFDDVEVVDTYPFEPNQCVVFIKTFNSLHSVRRMTVTGSEVMRRTLTINIETPD